MTTRLFVASEHYHAGSAVYRKLAVAARNPPPGDSPALPAIFAQKTLAFLSMVIANVAQNTLTILNIDAQFLRWEGDGFLTLDPYPLQNVLNMHLANDFRQTVLVMNKKTIKIDTTKIKTL
ncbi:TPA: hypothetical protein OKV43_000150 [Escherichia coli]|nr:hypothetical protein [Escherichia coli]